MRADPEGRFEAVINAYRLGDSELAASYFSEDCDYTVFIPANPGAYGGTLVGRAAVRERFQRVFKEFELLVYEASPIVANGNNIRAQLKYEVCHRDTRQELDGAGRIEATFADGKIIKWHAFHDADRIQAFLRLCQARSEAAFSPMDGGDRAAV